MHTSSTPNRACGGFTALELLVTITVAAIVTAFAAPALGSFLTANRIAAEANALVSAFSFARSEAVTRSSAISMCPYGRDANGVYACVNSTSWSGGWIVFTDATGTSGTFDGTDVLLRVFPGISGTDTLTATVSSLRFSTEGFLNAAAGASFALVPGHCSGLQRRAISLSLQGRAHTAPEAC
ncbi:GspH/FimT family pseudopilin [Sinimarinibacterium sp. CAU 1509]|uniref:GspH/FimT family pseudopilin n=1 Tax=Sinimarinibacterium sp. CAU 1509 TaxID=2562283 RepID=UPI00146A90AF|nr:GspH/FimT family pseudopilin [Sinimarinibacterium sp. CAU 1509]